jgi:hypothetical protein
MASSKTTGYQQVLLSEKGSYDTTSQCLLYCDASWKIVNFWSLVVPNILDTDPVETLMPLGNVVRLGECGDQLSLSLSCVLQFYTVSFTMHIVFSYPGEKRRYKKRWDFGKSWGLVSIAATSICR